MDEDDILEFFDVADEWYVEELTDYDYHPLPSLSEIEGDEYDPWDY